MILSNQPNEGIQKIVNRSGERPVRPEFLPETDEQQAANALVPALVGHATATSSLAASRAHSSALAMIAAAKAPNSVEHRAHADA